MSLFLKIMPKDQETEVLLHLVDVAKGRSSEPIESLSFPCARGF